MARAVIFIDGEYVRKIFKKQGINVDTPKFVRKVLELSHIEEKDLLRVYFYTSAPYQPTNPTVEEKARYRNFQRFEEFLKKQDSFEIKMGRTEKRDNNVYEQKMVDVLLSIDLVELSAKAKIESAVLIAGDSDFVPAMKKAKDNGVRVYLCCSSNKNEYHINLWNEADKRILIDKSIMKECSVKP